MISRHRLATHVPQKALEKSMYGKHGQTSLVGKIYTTGRTPAETGPLVN